MHGINIPIYQSSNNGIKEPTQVESNLYHHSNIDTWWVSQDERIFVYWSYYLSQYHPKTMLRLGQFYLGMKVLAWYIDIIGIKNKYILKYLYPAGIKH